MIKVVCNIQSTTWEKLIEKFASPRNFKVASDHTFEVNRPFTFPKPSPHFSVNYYIPKVATFKVDGPYFQIILHSFCLSRLAKKHGRSPAPYV